MRIYKALLRNLFGWLTM